MATLIEFRLLGPIEAGVGEHVLDIGGRKQRALLAILLLSVNQPVSRDLLVDRLWGEHPPAGAQHTLEVYISRLRKALEPAAGCQLVVTRPGAYLLRTSADSIDVRRFEGIAGEGRRALAAGAPARAAAQLQKALALWRGAPFADIADEQFAQAESTRLNELRVRVIEDRVDADLALGRHAEVISELAALVAAHPMRERLYELQMIALYRSGRQTEALEVYQTARRVLVAELGIEPSPALQRVQRAILAHDSSLDPPPATAARPIAAHAGTEPSGRLARTRRTRLAAAAGASLALGVTLIISGASLGGSGSNAVAASGADTVAVIDATRNIVTGDLTGIGRPGGVARGAGATWVTDTADDRLLEFNSAGQVVSQIPVGGGPGGVAIAAGEVWVADQLDRTVSEVNPAAEMVVAKVTVGNGPDLIAAGYRSIWVTNLTDSTLSRIDAGSSSVVATIPLGTAPAGLGVGRGGVWVATWDGRLLSIDPHTDKVRRAFVIGDVPTGLALGAGAVWVVSSDGMVARVDPRTGRVRKIRLGGSLAGAAFADGVLWAAGGSSGGVVRLDPRTDSTQHIHVGNQPTDLAASGGDVFATVLPSPASHRGGTLTVLANLSPYNWVADPAVAYDLRLWQMLSVTNDGLVTYRRVGGPAGETVVPDLAAALPEPADGGLTYTFHLRRSIHYSDGTLVRPEDFRHAIERVFAINAGPAGLYTGIVGAAECERAPRHCNLGRGITSNDRANTVTFHLSSPDPDFLFKLAFPFADAIPAQVPGHVVEPTELPSTGPYVTEAFVPGHQWVLVRNPWFRQWSDQAQPAGYPDRIVLRLNLAPGSAVSSVEHGRADVLLFPTPARIQELETRYPTRLHSGPTGVTVGLVLNTRSWPFDVLAARQAVNYAIDRSKLIDLIGGPLTAQPTCQILPPGMPGYLPFCPYTLNPSPSGAWTAPDLARAEQLVTASGTRGARVTVLAGAFGTAIPADTTGSYLVSVLDQLGYRASLRVINNPGAYARQLYDSRHGMQIGWFSWYQDYPAPSDFIRTLLTCHSFTPDDQYNINAAEFCSPQVDAQVQEALALQTAAPNTAGALWAQIDEEIVREAPWVPVYNPRSLVVLSARVGNYQFNPYWFVLIDQLWVR